MNETTTIIYKKITTKSISPQKTKAKKISPQKRKEIYHLYKSKKYSKKELIEKYSITINQLNYLISKLNTKEKINKLETKITTLKRKNLKQKQEPKPIHPKNININITLKKK